MTEADPASLPAGADRGAGGALGALGIAGWLSLAAAPTFALMALLTAASGDMICAAGQGSPLSGMVPMYLLMSAFHLAPWLKLAAQRQGSVRRR
jgi:hypothetical protein